MSPPTYDAGGIRGGFRAAREKKNRPTASRAEAVLGSVETEGGSLVAFTAVGVSTAGAVKLAFGRPFSPNYFNPIDRAILRLGVCAAVTSGAFSAGIPMSDECEYPSISMGCEMLRERTHGWPVTYIARRCGMKVGTVQHHIEGSRTPRPAAREKYAAIFGIDARAWDRVA